MTICQIVTAVILATKMDKSTGTMPAPAGKAVLAFICLFVAGVLLTPLRAHNSMCTHTMPLAVVSKSLLEADYCMHVAAVCTLLS